MDLNDPKEFDDRSYSMIPVIWRTLITQSLRWYLHLRWPRLIENLHTFLLIVWLKTFKSLKMSSEVKNGQKSGDVHCLAFERGFWSKKEVWAHCWALDDEFSNKTSFQVIKSSEWYWEGQWSSISYWQEPGCIRRRRKKSKALLILIICQYQNIIPTQSFRNI